MPNVQTALQANALSKSYKTVQALKDISLEIGPGVTAILGQNGAGKTTFIKCALGLEKPTAGTLQMFGRSPRTRKTREHVGVMLQDTELPDLLTGRELLDLFASYYPAPMNSEAIIELAQINAFVDQRYGKLSGGQKRRIQFALAIVGDPDLVFLDEPTTGLDTEARKALWETVRSFVATGRSIILTTHYLEEADALADRIIILSHGRIIADGPAEQIRQGASGATIRCETKLALAEISVLPACTHAGKAGRITEIRTSDTVATLRALLAQDANLSELTVSKPRLEDIFEELTQ